MNNTLYTIKIFFILFFVNNICVAAEKAQDNALNPFKSMYLFMEVPYQKPCDTHSTEIQQIWFTIKKVQKLEGQQKNLAAQLKNNTTADAITLEKFNPQNPMYAQFII